MKVKASAIAVAALLALAAQAANATEAVGYNVVTVPANSDVLVSVPFNNDVEATFTVGSVSTSGVTVNEALSADTYGSGYYVRFIDGNGEGLWSTISANGDGGLELSNTDVLSYISSGDTFRVYAHHTVGSVFPSGMYGVSYTNGVSLFVYNNTASGINKSPSASVNYVPALKRWNNPNQVLNPDSMLLIRNGSSATLSYICNGDVPDYNVALLVPAATAKDTMIGSGFPVSVLASAIQGGTGRSFYLYNNAASGENKSPSLSVNYVPALSRWNNPNQVVASSEGFILRTSSSEAGGKITIQKPY
jgi:uncharacterized protein (TIGR02597 family)